MYSDTAEYKGFIIEVETDEMSESPREWCDHDSKMLCMHNSYNLGDKQLDSNDYKSWEAVEDAHRKDSIILPLYLYDHSGITMNTTGFGCKWDSGQVGIIAWNKKDIREVYGVKRISKKMRNKIQEYMIAEVEEYDQYLRGEVYAVSIRKEDEDEIIDSQGMNFGSIESIIEDAKRMIDCY